MRAGGLDRLHEPIANLTFVRGWLYACVIETKQVFSSISSRAQSWQSNCVSRRLLFIFKNCTTCDPTLFDLPFSIRVSSSYLVEEGTLEMGHQVDNCKREAKRILTSNTSLMSCLSTPSGLSGQIMMYVAVHSKTAAVQPNWQWKYFSVNICRIYRPKGKPHRVERI